MNAEATFKKEDIVGREMKFGTYIASSDEKHDVIFVKEYVTLKDGQRIPQLTPVVDYKRKFWITQDAYRNHQEKKEWEDLNKLMEFKSTQVLLAQTVSAAMGVPGAKRTLRQWTRSPYLYGTDISITSLLKNDYQQRWPAYKTPISTVAVMDIETTTDEGNYPHCLSLTFGSRCVIAIHKNFLKGVFEPEVKLRKCFQEQLGEVIIKRNIRLEVVFVDSITEMCSEVFKRAHVWKPDFVTIWNMSFDLRVLERWVNSEGGSWVDIVSDPSVPPKLRYYHFEVGDETKKSASGKEEKLAPAARWHIVTCTASFQFVDSMCIYYRLRMAEGILPGGYNLDNVLKTNGVGGKLKFDVKADSGLQWHRIMQADHPIEYLVYNLWDCISVEVLDEKTQDLRMVIEAQCGLSDYSRLKTNPGKTVDDLHFFALENKKVISTFPGSRDDENDEMVVDRNEWICTLPSHLMAPVGLHVLEEIPTLATEVCKHVADLDIEGTYPNVQAGLNIGKETTHREVGPIDGLDEYWKRSIGVNLTAGIINCIEIGMTGFNLPSPEKVLELFEQHLTLQAQNSA